MCARRAVRGTVRNRPMLCDRPGFGKVGRPLCGCDERSTLCWSRAAVSRSFAPLSMRLAWFSPLAPVRSGIASYSTMVLPALAARHDIALFVGDDVWAARRAGARVGTDGFAAVESPWGPIRSAYDFAPIHQARPFDLVVLSTRSGSTG